jgi:lipopolysaccharide/colanic/teichoic acid biosynthesis glycosyltransferase
VSVRFGLIEMTGCSGGRGPAGSWGKRAVDILGAVAALVFYAPVFTVLVLAVRLTRQGPILAREATAGLKGAPFSRWRLHAAERETIFDRLLRRGGLADLPSAINVIAGDMSLVGPEPHSLERYRHLSKGRADYAKRFQARPGLLWPRAADGEPSLDAELDYISRWSGVLDLKVAGRCALDGLLGEQPAAD